MTEFYLDGMWVKSTPAFNKELCERHRVAPLEFNGREDSIFQPYNLTKKKYMEYVADHGSFMDLPWERIMAACIKAYPRYFELLDRNQDFSKEALAENP